MYTVTFTAHQQRKIVRTPHFFGAGNATVHGWMPIISCLLRNVGVADVER